MFYLRVIHGIFNLYETITILLILFNLFKIIQIMIILEFSFKSSYCSYFKLYCSKFEHMKRTRLFRSIKKIEKIPKLRSVTSQELGFSLVF